MNTAFRRVALVGRPNCGKTSVFNALTGLQQKVANYPGVTVEYKKARIETATGPIELIDLPGLYSLTPQSADEEITVRALTEGDDIIGPLDGLVLVGDASNLVLCLRLLLSLKPLGLPIIFVVNMMDVATRLGLRLDLSGLAQDLGVTIVPTHAHRRHGIDDVMTALAEVPPRTTPLPPFQQSETLRQRHDRARTLVKTYVGSTDIISSQSDRLDRILMHPVWGISILLLVLMVVFQAVFAWATPVMDGIDAGVGLLAGGVDQLLPNGLVKSLLIDGVIAGVGSVIIFLPQILILFLFILLLEDSGYMVRAAVLMDRLMGMSGLNGRSFIPLLSSFACAIPGIMATRFIPDPKQRLVTILLAPLMTCSARIPVYTLIISAFVPQQVVGGVLQLQGLVMFGLYAAGILGAIVVSHVINWLFLRQGVQSEFVMELPRYQWPNARNVALGLVGRSQAFLVRAGGIIFLSSVVIWVLSSFPAPPPDSTAPAITHSLAARIGDWLHPIFAPVGFSWQMAVALIPGMAAREVVVGALGTLYAVGDGQESLGSLEALLRQQWSLATALAFLAWYVFAPQCLATLATIRRETNSWRWPVITFVYMTALAYGAAFVTYRVASWAMG